MNTILRSIGLLLAFLILGSNSTFARGGHGGAKSSSTGPGTGAKASTTRVSGYTRKNGTHVDEYSKTTPDKKFENNWSTKGNQNPKTGKEGTRVTSPKKSD